MSVHFRVFEDHALVVGHFGGILDKVVFAEGIRRLTEHPSFKPGFDRVAFLQDDLDLSRFDFSDMTEVKGRMVNAYFGNLPEPAPEGPLFRIAAISNTSINTQVFNLYCAVLNTAMPSLVSSGLFQNAHEALAWLGKTGLDPDELGIDRMTDAIE